MTKIFFDCEFTGLHQNTTLISIGLVSECGKTFYAEFTDYNKSQVNDWIIENVISKLHLPQVPEFSAKGDDGNSFSKGDKMHVKKDLQYWLEQFEKIEIWSDCLAYDWVLFCQLFNGAFGIPKNIYYIPFDICTLMIVKGVDPDINREQFCDNMIEVNDVRNWGTPDNKHNALWDAYVIRECYKRLTR